MWISFKALLCWINFTRGGTEFFMVYNHVNHILQCLISYSHSALTFPSHHVLLFVTLRTVARQAPLSMGFSRQEYWNGLPFPSPEELPDPGIKPCFFALHADSLPFELQGSLTTPIHQCCFFNFFIEVNVKLPYHPLIVILGFYSRVMKTIVYIKTCMLMCSTVLFMITLKWKPSKYV